MKQLPFLELIQDDLNRVEILLREHPPDQHESIGVALDHLVGGGGKRLRPALVLLSSCLYGADEEESIFAAAATEMLHTATLIHDDLIDGSLMRRGAETLNANWPPGATVLAGDYVFARAAYLVSQTNNIRLMSRFAETLMIICNGEVRQLFDGREGQPSLQEYERRIYAKTASLIALSAEAGPILAQTDGEIVESLRLYGERLGLAFQIVDDVLDFVADEETLGKPVGSDLRQGLITLPTLLFLQRDPDYPALRRVLAGTRSQEVVEDAVQAVATSPIIDQAMEMARQYADQAQAALEGTPENPYRSALLDLTDFAVNRRF